MLQLKILQYFKAKHFKCHQAYRLAKQIQKLDTIHHIYRFCFSKKINTLLHQQTQWIQRIKVTKDFYKCNKILHGGGRLAVTCGRVVRVGGTVAVTYVGLVWLDQQGLGQVCLMPCAQCSSSAYNLLNDQTLDAPLKESDPEVDRLEPLWLVLRAFHLILLLLPLMFIYPLSLCVRRLENRTLNYAVWAAGRAGMCESIRMWF